VSGEWKRTVERHLEGAIKVQIVVEEIEKEVADRLRAGATSLQRLGRAPGWAARLKDMAESLKWMRIHARQEVSSQRRNLTRLKKRRAVR
jgi:hypothetical protein